MEIRGNEWKIHPTMKPKFMSSTESHEKRTMYSKSHRCVVMIGNDTNKIIQKFFDSFFNRYQVGLEQSMKGSNFIFDYV